MGSKVKATWAILDLELIDAFRKLIVSKQTLPLGEHERIAVTLKVIAGVEDSRISEAALYNLVYLQDNAADQVLRDILRDREDPITRARAVRVLHSVQYSEQIASRDVRIASGLVKDLYGPLTEGDTKTRENATLILGGMRTETAFSVLLSAFPDPDPRIRAVQIDEFANAKGEKYDKVLIEALRDEVPEVRASAVRALAGRSEAIPALLNLLEMAYLNPRAVYAVTEALPYFSDLLKQNRSEQLVLSFLQANLYNSEIYGVPQSFTISSGEPHGGVLEALARLGWDSTLKLLADLRTNVDSMGELTLLTVTGDSSSSKVIRILEAFLTDRRSAFPSLSMIFWYLKEIGTPNAMSSLERHSKRYPEANKVLNTFRSQGLSYVQRFQMGDEWYKLRLLGEAKERIESGTVPEWAKQVAEEGLFALRSARDLRLTTAAADVLKALEARTPRRETPRKR